MSNNFLVPVTAASQNKSKFSHKKHPSQLAEVLNMSPNRNSNQKRKQLSGQKYTRLCAQSIMGVNKSWDIFMLKLFWCASQLWQFGGNNSLKRYFKFYDLNAEPVNQRYFSKAAEFYRQKLKEQCEKPFSQDQYEQFDPINLNDKPNFDEGRIILTMNMARHSVDSNIVFQNLENQQNSQQNQLRKRGTIVISLNEDEILYKGRGRQELTDSSPNDVQLNKVNYQQLIPNNSVKQLVFEEIKQEKEQMLFNNVKNSHQNKAFSKSMIDNNHSQSTAQLKRVESSLIDTIIESTRQASDMAVQKGIELQRKLQESNISEQVSTRSSDILNKGLDIGASLYLIAESCGGGGNYSTNQDRPEARIRENEVDLFELSQNHNQSQCSSNSSKQQGIRTQNLQFNQRTQR
ncbi:UNKNOWN [Stylonychia lemnae]|uniref:Uncharacterized protein n=1 Tax=Stylonychia lemnae TaxID=5949 RepID=A0A077ZRH2_STYLE|nr:UNKNOWN [Stylonychia lemnae]|eukprot:CDW72059.1 UNKNOWN [Stylonychia lemnae]